MTKSGGLITYTNFNMTFIVSDIQSVLPIFNNKQNCQLGRLPMKENGASSATEKLVISKFIDYEFLNLNFKFLRFQNFK